MKKYSRKYVFDTEGNLLPIEDRTYITNEGYKLVLIDGGSRNLYVSIQIENWITEVRMEGVKIGNIKYPFHPSVFNVGYYGKGRHTSTSNGKATKTYQLWKDMLRRSYCPKYHAKRPTYEEAAVNREWHNFQAFADWFEQSNYQEGWHLDKDLLSGDSKIYSTDTCLFIPMALNLFLTNTKSDNTSGYVGVSARADGKWIATISDIKTKKKIHIGLFSTPEEASQVYQTKRAEFAAIWQERMTDVLPVEVINHIK